MILYWIRGYNMENLRLYLCCCSFNFSISSIGLFTDADGYYVDWGYYGKDIRVIADFKVYDRIIYSITGLDKIRVYTKADKSIIYWLWDKAKREYIMWYSIG